MVRLRPQMAARKMAKLRKNSGVSSSVRHICEGHRLSRVPIEQLGRSWPPGGERLLEPAKRNETIRKDVLRRLLKGEGEPPQPKKLPRFTERDLKRTREVVAAYAPHHYDEIEFFIRVKSPPDPKTLARTRAQMRKFGIEPPRVSGRPVDPMTERRMLAVELLKCCGVEAPEKSVADECSSMREAVDTNSIKRNYLARLAVPFKTNNRLRAKLRGKLRDELRRRLLWRLHEMNAANAATAGSTGAADTLPG